MLDITNLNKAELLIYKGNMEVILPSWARITVVAAQKRRACSRFKFLRTYFMSFLRG